MRCLDISDVAAAPAAAAPLPGLYTAVLPLLAAAARSAAFPRDSEHYKPISVSGNP